MTWTPHTTVAAVTESNGRFLMVEEKTDDGLVLNQPAGHLEVGESLADAVIRETFEETAWRFHPRGLVGVYRWQAPGSGVTFLRFCFWGEVTDHRPDHPLDQEIRRALWKSRDELRNLTAERLRSPLVMLAVNDFLAGKRYPLDLITEL